MHRLHTHLHLRKRDLGFSFIELLAYMAIAALLVLAAVPQFSGFREKAHVTTLQNDVHNGVLAIEASKIGTVATRDDSGIHLASETLSEEDISPEQVALDEAIATVTPSRGNDLSAIAVGGLDYEVHGISDGTDLEVVFSSTASPDKGYAEGMNLVSPDGTAEPIPDPVDPEPSDAPAPAESDMPTAEPTVAPEPTTAPTPGPTAAPEPTPTPTVKVPSKPLVLKSVVSSGTGASQTLTWDRSVSTAGGVSGKIEFGTTSSFTSVVGTAALTSLASTSQAATSASLAAKTYYARVSYVDGDGKTLTSNVLAWTRYATMVLESDSNIEPITGVVQLNMNAYTDLSPWGATSASVQIGSQAAETTTGFPFQATKIAAFGSNAIKISLTTKTGDKLTLSTTLTRKTGPSITAVGASVSGKRTVKISQALSTWASQTDRYGAYIRVTIAGKTTATTLTSFTATSYSVTAGTGAGTAVIWVGSGGTWKSATFSFAS